MAGSLVCGGGERRTTIPPNMSFGWRLAGPGRASSQISSLNSAGNSENRLKVVAAIVQIQHSVRRELICGAAFCELLINEKTGRTHQSRLSVL